MQGFMKLLLSLSVSGGILALVLYGLKPLLRHRVSRAFSYYIWLVVLVRFALPFSLQSSLMNAAFQTPADSAVMSIPEFEPNISADEYEPVSDVEALPYSTQVDNRADDSILPEQSNANFSSLNRLFLIWVSGAVISIIFSIISYLRFMRCIKKSAAGAMESELSRLDEYAGNMRIGQKITLIRSGCAPTPMLTGLFRPCIILPDREYTDDQFRNILIHELTHIKRCDIAVKWLTVIVAAAHWFNPVVYLMKHEINRCCELSCDEAVIKAMDAGDRQCYGETLIWAASQRQYPELTTAMCHSKKTLEERLVSIMKYRNKTRGVILSSVLAVVLIASAVALGTSVEPADSASRSDAPYTYDFDALYDYQATAIEDSGDIGGIISLLPVPSDYLVQSGFSLQISEQPYKLTISYTLNSEGEEFARKYAGTQSLTGLIWDTGCEKNALILYSLIDKLEFVTFEYPCLYSDREAEVTGYTIPRAIAGSYGELSELWTGDRSVLTAATALLGITNYEITFTDLFAMSAKGDALSMQDFDAHMGQSAGSSVTFYPVEGGFKLRVAKDTGAVEIVTPSGIDFMDIRDGDVENFIEQHRRQALDYNCLWAITQGGKYTAESYAIDTSSVNPDGLYDSLGLRIIEEESQETVWSMDIRHDNGWLYWSSDGRYLAAYIIGQTCEAFIIDMSDLSLHNLPGFDELAEYLPEIPDSGWPWAYIMPSYWVDENTLCVNFIWSFDNCDEFNGYSGSYNYNIASREISDVNIILQP